MYSYFSSFLHKRQYHKHYSAACFFFFTLLHILELLLYQYRDSHMIFKIPSMCWPLPNLYVKFRPLLWVIDFPTAYLTLRISNWFQMYHVQNETLVFISRDRHYCVGLFHHKVRAPFPQLLRVLAANGSQLPPFLENCLQLKWPTLSWNWPGQGLPNHWLILDISTNTKRATSHDLKIYRGLRT